MKPGEDKDLPEEAGTEAESRESEAEETGPGDADDSQVDHTVTDVPEKTKHRQRERRSSGAHLGMGLPLADPGHYEIRTAVAFASASRPEISGVLQAHFPVSDRIGQLVPERF